MNHDEKLTAYALGELEGRELAEMKARVAASSELRRQVAEIQQFSQEMRSEFASEPLPPGRALPRPSPRWKPTLYAGSVAVLVAGLVVALNTPSDPKSEAIDNHRAKVILNAPGPALNANSELRQDMKLSEHAPGDQLDLDLTDFGATLPEGVTSEQIRSVFESHRAELLACYKTAAVQVPDLRGAIEFSWLVNVEGRAQEILVEQDSAGSGTLSSCVAQKMRGWKFPLKVKSAALHYSIGFKRR